MFGIPVHPNHAGFPFNLDLVYGLAMGTYPPRTRDPVRGSLPLLSREVEHFLGPTALTDRPTVQEAVDLITGAPLLQDVDFEIPFGGAVFRHLRTYSEPMSIGWLDWDCYDGALVPNAANEGGSSLYWDWQGQGWMMGEAPILLVDAQYWGTSQFESGLPLDRWCYLVIDSHHAIPFKFDEVNETYVAPPRFGAILSHNGDWDNGAWITEPSQFYIWLDRQTVQYTFQVYREDVAYRDDGGPTWVSLHNPPGAERPGPNGNEGQGVPYYGLLTQIDDRLGHRVRIEYCAQHQFPCDNQSQSGCVGCCQNCHEKGQIRKVELLTGAGTQEENIEWTLLYAYRAFHGQHLTGAPSDYKWHRQQAVHCIRAYNREVTEEFPACGTIEFEAFAEALGSATWPSSPTRENVIDALAAYFVDPSEELDFPTDWLYEARYVYTDTNPVFNTGWFSTETSYTGDKLFGWDVENWQHSPRLLLSSVSKRESTETGAAVETTHHAYRYETAALEGTGRYEVSMMRAVYGPAAINAIRDGLADHDEEEVLLEHWPIGMLTLLEDEEIADSAAEEPTTRRFIDCADLHFEHWGTARYGGHATTEGFYASAYHEEMVDEFLNAEPNRLAAQIDGTYFFNDRRGTGGDGKLFKVHRFLYMPTEHIYAGTPPAYGYSFGHLGNLPFPYIHPWPLRPIRLEPFMYLSQTEMEIEQDDPLNLREALWIVAIDEFAKLEHCEEPDFSLLLLTNPGLDPYEDDPRPVTRRVVWINAAGYVLKDTTWRIKDGAILASSGSMESFEYDEHMRLILRRSFGWGSPENIVGGEPDPDNGLVYHYAYDDSIEINGEPTTEVGAVGVQRGENESGQVIWQTVVTRDPERPDLILKEYRFPGPDYATDPVAGPEFPPPGLIAASANVTEHIYELVEPDSEPGQPDPEPFEQRVRVETVKRPAAQMSDLAGTGLYWPLEKKVFDDKGRLVWRQYGSLRTEPAGSETDLTELFLDYTAYDEQGRVHYTVVDAVEDQDAVHPGTGDSLDVPASSDVERDSEADALEYATVYEYYPTMGEKRVYFPSGRQNMTLYNGGLSSPDIEQQIIKDFETEPAQQGYVITAIHSPGQHNFLSQGQVQTSLQVSLFQLINSQPPDWFAQYALLWELKAEYNSSGALTGLKAESEDGQTLDTKVALSMFGEVGRSIDPDGTITRHVHDPLGRIERSYRGTDDKHPYWGTAPITPTSGHTDNLSLIEKRYYGEGVHDARQLIEVRTYRDKLEVQYPTSSNPTATEDDEGWARRFGYDWRMRQAVVTQLEEGPRDTAEALSHTYTFLDNLDRPRFVATYGPTAPEDELDPRNLNPVCTLPTAADIMAGSPTPLRLTEYVYNSRGQVQETRQYLCLQQSSPPANQYLSTRTYHDHGDRPVLVIAPGGGRQAHAYDALGRQYSSAVLAKDASSGTWWEMTRTDTLYDTDGNPTETATWERLHGTTTGAELSEANENAVVSRTYSWYNVKKHLVATADIGTGSDDNDEFAYQESTEVRPPDAPAYETGSPPSINRQGLPDWVKITCYEYDDKGNKIKEMTDADGSGGNPPVVTLNSYTDFGQISKVIENSEDPDNRRITGYHYEDGRLIHIGAVLPSVTDPEWWASSGLAQLTELQYGAEVVNRDFSSMTPHTCYNNGWVKSVHFPDPDTGTASEDPSLSFKYFSDGLVAMRTDARGVIFKYSYDEQSRLTVIDVEYPSGMTSAPADRFTRLDFEYDVLGSLTRATARMDGTTQPPVIVTDNVYEYDDFGNLLLEKQQHAAAAGSSSPRIDYDWAFSAALSSAGSGHGYNLNRLQSMTYPTREPVSGAQRRTITLDYGNNTTDFDSQLSRITKIADGSASNALGTLAVYAYAGQSRRVEQRYGGELSGSTYAARQAFRSSAGPVGGIGYDRLDRFGRIKDLFYQNDGGTTLYRAQHGYDGLDQRLYARVTQATVSSVTHDNDRSHLYGYDQLRRLQAAGLGRLTSGNGSLETSSPTPREVSWTLDHLGNWAGDSTHAGREISGPLNGEPEETTHDTDWFNRLEETEETTGSTTVTRGHVYDAAGNLVFDGDFYYQFDAWSRLVQVNDPPAQSPAPTFSAQGVMTSGTAGPWLVHYTYDALGRLVRRQTPYPQPGVSGNEDKRFEHYYYDGVRRIAETFTDPLPAGDGDDPASGEEEEEEPPAPATYTWTEREYVWGPAYVDELVCQLGGGESPWKQNAVRYAALDANFNVVGVVGGQARDSGGSPASVPGGFGGILEQYAYDPYGSILHCDTAVTGGTSADPNLPRNRVGHQGLFADQFSASTVSAQLQPGVHLAYHNRNRTFLSGLARFAQSDPLGLSQVLLTGEMQLLDRPTVESVVPIELYPDGLSLFAYVGTSPVSRVDPFGTLTLVGEGLGALLQGMMRGREGTTSAATGAHVMREIGRWAKVARTLIGGLSHLNDLATLLNEPMVWANADAEPVADPAQGWETPQQSVPWDEAARDGEVTLTKVDEKAADNPAMISQGFTKREYYRDGNGQKWSVFKNPTTERWKGAKLSSHQ